MSDINDRIAGLSPEKRALLLSRLNGRDQTQHESSIKPRDASHPCRLSFAQERLWFIACLEPDRPLYLITWGTRLAGPLDEDHIRSAFETIVARHDVFRTTFHETEEGPVQHISPDCQVDMPLVDLSGLEREEQDRRVRQFLQEDRGKIIDLESGPVFRTAMLRLGSEEHVLVLTIHHALFDGWSVGIFFRELGEVYQALVEGREPALPELPVQYADFAQWQREWLTGERLERQVSYWREHLGDKNHALEFPTDFPRARRIAYEGSHAEASVGLDRWEALRALATQAGATPFMVTLAALRALLLRCTGQTDIVIGTPTAGRTRVEVEQLLGFFVNMIPLRTDASGDPTFLELVRRERLNALDGFAHQDVPFERLVDELNVPRDLSRTPIYQIAFQLINFERGSTLVPGVTMERVEGGEMVPDHDMYVEAAPLKDRLRLKIAYRSDLFERETMQRLAARFASVLEQVIADPGRTVSSLDILLPGEREKMLDEWNRTATAYPRDRCVHDLFDEQAKATPDATAAQFGDTKLSYDELRRLSDRMANRLLTQGVQPGELVCVSMTPSPAMIVALLGVMKAGAAYVPLDTTYPEQRLNSMLRDTRARVVIAQDGVRGALGEFSGTVFELDPACGALAEIADEPPGVPVAATDLAYVMYTSGSTGQPKGTRVTHRGIVRLVRDTNYIELRREDRIAQVSNCAFDAFTFEAWGALLNGACLVGIEKEAALSPDEFGASLKREAISVLFVTSALFHQTAAANPSAFSSLRCLITGGDVINPDRVRQVLDAGAPEHFLAAYGPTENTTYTTTWPLNDLPEDAAEIPLGRPIANSTVQVLDENMRPVPPGVLGELCCGGDGVARGYLNREDLTADRFVPDPFSDDPDALLYRTGDLARFRLDGAILFGGRRDTQVKIRGFRVELDEIQTQLGRHERVRETAVIAREDTPGDKRLVAYFVAAGGEEVASAELRNALRESLPDYMVPAAFVQLDQLPLTPNGKLDREALPAPSDAAGPASADAASHGLSGTEERLIGVWGQVLGIPSVEPDDNFFDLGGHSLMAVRLFSAIQQEFGVRLPLATLFQSPTLAGIARALEEEIEPDWSCLVKMQPEGTKPPLFCLHPIGGEVIRFAHLGRELAPDQPVYGLQARGLDGTQQPFDALEPMAAHYVEEMRRVQPQGPYLMLGFSSGGIVAFEMARQLRRDGQQVGFLGILDAGAPGYRKPRISPPWHPAYWVMVLCNVPAWLAGYGERTSEERMESWLARLRTFRNGGYRQPSEARDDLGSYIRGVIAESPEERRGAIATMFRALSAYRPEPYAGEITLFRSDLRPLLAKYDIFLGWRRYARRRLRVILMPGSHMTMLQPPRVQLLAEKLRECLDAATAQTRE